MVPVDVVPIRLTVNGREHHLEVAPERTLLAVLRDDLALTGTKEGCAVGVCGICSVLVDGDLQTACLYPAVHADGRAVTSIEGLEGPAGELSAVQQAFIDHGGFQCGICTPGQVMAATALLAVDPRPDEATVVEWLTGHLCRCTGYYGIVASVLAAAGAAPPLAIRPPIETAAADDSAAVGHDASERSAPSAEAAS
jgi:aerobic-type carbon monoxide dehydrogenase small subunit (CoxS/CutS family)